MVAIEFESEQTVITVLTLPVRHHTVSAEERPQETW